MIWSDLLVPGVPIVEKIVRPLIVYAFLIVLIRLFGKRELAQLNPYDLIVLLTISNTVQNAIIGNDNSVTGGLIGAVTLMIFNFLVVRFLYRHEKIDRIIEGDQTVLVENGRVIKEALDRELITIPELESVAHRQGFESLQEVHRCILEPGGTLAMFGKKPSTGEMRQEELVERLDEIKALLLARGSA
ncbi:MAG TPA: YetF domain-containing protein [Vicinamibacterales bacterium]|nr:YetF domain-containing protein [Vicinamibacterales bacterium]